MNNKIKDFIENLKKREIDLTTNNTNIKCLMPKGIYLKKENYNFIKKNKKELVLYLSDSKKLIIYPLTPLQEGMLFHFLNEDEQNQYCGQIYFTCKGQLNIDALKLSWQEVINNNDILRTKFIWKNVAHPVQVVTPFVKIPWFYNDFSNLELNQQDEKIIEYLLQDRLTKFDLDKPCIMRLHLIKLSDIKHIFIWTKHHILLDGWSNSILFQEL